MPKTPSAAGFQPRTTPAERRAFFDLQRQLGAASEGDDGITQADADARYVNVAGDTMTGLLEVNPSDGGPALRMKRAGDSPYWSFAKQDNTRIAYIQGKGNVADGEGLKLQTENVGGTGNIIFYPHGVTVLRLTPTGVNAYLPVTLAADPTVPLGAATKAYVDATPNSTLIRRRSTRPSQSFPAGASTQTMTASVTDNENVGGITNTAGTFNVPTAGTYGIRFFCGNGDAMPTTFTLSIAAASAFAVIRQPGAGNTNQSTSTITYLQPADNITFQVNNQSAAAIATVPTIEIVRLGERLHPRRPRAGTGVAQGRPALDPGDARSRSSKRSATSVPHTGGSATPRRDASTSSCSTARSSASTCGSPSATRSPSRPARSASPP